MVTERTYQGLGLVGLQVADKVPLYIVWQQRCLVKQFLCTQEVHRLFIAAKDSSRDNNLDNRAKHTRVAAHLDIILTKDFLPSVVCFSQRFHRLCLADSHNALH